jgi:hypothetical protein
VHLPPCNDSEPGSYPTLWVMHGDGNNADMCVKLPPEVGSIADSLGLDGAPFIIAVPNGATGRPEFLDGEFEQVLADVDQTFRTIDDPRSRAIAGVSAGGTAAAYLAAENEATDFAALGLFMTAWGQRWTNVSRRVLLAGIWRQSCSSTSVRTRVCGPTPTTSRRRSVRPASPLSWRAPRWPRCGVCGRPTRCLGGLVDRPIRLNRDDGERSRALASSGIGSGTKSR